MVKAGERAIEIDEYGRDKVKTKEDVYQYLKESYLEYKRVMKEHNFTEFDLFPFLKDDKKEAKLYENFMEDYDKYKISKFIDGLYRRWARLYRKIFHHEISIARTFDLISVIAIMRIAIERGSRLIQHWEMPEYKDCHFCYG